MIILFKMLARCFVTVPRIEPGATVPEQIFVALNIPEAEFKRHADSARSAVI